MLWRSTASTLYRSRSTPSILPSAKVVFPEQHPLYRRLLLNPHYMLNLR